MEFRLGHATVYVRDFERALDFYDLALGLPLRLRDDGRGYAAFATEGADLTLARVPPDAPDADRLVGRETGIALRVPDLDAAHEALRERGVVFSMPPSRQPWVGRMAILEDPEGNRLMLGESLDGAPRREPPVG